MTVKKKSSSRFQKNMVPVYILVTVLAVVANASIVYFMFHTTRFSALSKSSFILVNIVLLVLLAVLNFLLMRAFMTRKKGTFATACVLLALFLALGSYGTFAILKINRNVDQITSTTATESIMASVVVYDAQGNYAVAEPSELDGKTVGFATGTGVAEIGKNNLNATGAKISYKEYQDYSSLALGLFSNEIEAAILPQNYQAMFQNETGLAEFLTNTKSIADYSDTITVTKRSGSDKDITKEPFTVLLVGNADGLSDTMILCSVNPISMKVTMTSLARDSYVPISCYNGGQSRLNAAHAVSIDCTMQTIENLVGVKIDYYVDVNFQCVVDVVNALGGIVVNSPAEFVGQNASSNRGSYTVWVPKGDNVKLNGEQALAFARERHLFATGDFARQAHQQEVIAAMMRSLLRTRDVNTFLNVMDAAGKNLQTNMSMDQMISFMTYTMQKINRFYDQDHPEHVLDIEGWRVTGYSSSLWSDATQSALYIYRLWNGSLADTKEAIERNLMMTGTITPMHSMQASVNWVFNKPTISNEVYNETVVAPEVPTTIGNYVGRNISALQAWAQGLGIAVYQTTVQDSSQADGTIIYQDIPEGTPIDAIVSINVTVVDNSGYVEATPVPIPEEKPHSTEEPPAPPVVSPESSPSPSPSPAASPAESSETTTPR